MTRNHASRGSRRGTMLVVVLGLLVALFVIGTSFSYVTLSERRAAANYMDRQRALDLALDGVEYSVARLRAESGQKWYEGLGPSAAGQFNGRQEPGMYIASLDGTSVHPKDAPKPAGSADKAVSWPRNQSVTSQTKEADANWVDLNGDGVRGGNESAFGADRFPSAVALGAPGTLAGVTGFKGDGLNAGQVRTRDVAFLEGQEYGAAGTYRELGDYFRVRVMDAASLLNLNSFK
ncbi:MAG: hypothetical protein IT463_08780, partial [Planctomycetes bacterium]|nr:hypothetical protein [Planctomycetota bacterium]